jgi:hypothetical protein
MDIKNVALVLMIAKFVLMLIRALNVISHSIYLPIMIAVWKIAAIVMLKIIKLSTRGNALIVKQDMTNQNII